MTLLLTGMTLNAAELRQVAAAPLKGTIVLDGVPDEEAWSKAEEQSGFTAVRELNDATLSPTTFKVLASDTGLYFAFTAIDTNIKTQLRNHDEAVWADDCLEIFIAPLRDFSSDRNIREYYHFIFNPSGSRFDSKVTGGVSDPHAYNPHWQLATQITDTGYTAEVFIPYYAFDLSARSRDWRLNVGREDRNVIDSNKSTLALSTWNPTTNFTEADNFGVLTGIPVDFERYDVTINELQFGARTVAGETINVVLANFQGAPGRQLTVKTILRQNDKITGGLSTVEITLPASGAEQFALPVNISESGDYAITVLVLDNGVVIAEAKAVRHASISALALDLLQPCYRDTIYLAQPERNVVFDVTLRCPAAQRPTATVTTIITDSAGVTVAEANKQAPDATERFSFDAANYAPGKYQITVRLLHPGLADDMLALPFQVVANPERGNVVWVDENRRLILNGKPFFARGFLGGSSLVFDIIADAGYNFMHVYTLNRQPLEDIIAFLDQANKRGIKIAFYPMAGISGGFWGFKINNKTSTTLPRDREEKMLELVAAVKDHPAFLGWYLYDEPRGAEYCLELLRLYKLLCEVDPHHPVFGLDNSAAGLVNKKGSCDIHILDLYPSPRHDNSFSIPIATLFRSATTVIDGTGREGVWYCPMAFDRASFATGPVADRAMTYREIRCSVYLTLAAGVTGMVPYKIGNPTLAYFERNGNTGIFGSPEMKIGYLEGIGPELDALSEVLLSPGGTVAADATIKVAKRVYNGKTFVIAVNPEPNQVQATLNWPGNQDAEIKVLSEKRALKAVAGKLTDHFAPYAVHLYTDDLTFADPVDVAALEAKIAREMQEFGPAR